MNSANGRGYRTAWRVWTGLVIIPALALAVPGLLIIIDDLQTTDEFLDGFGLFFGVVLVTVAVFTMIMVGVALLASARHPRAALIVSGVWVALAALATFGFFGASGESLPFFGVFLLWLVGFVSLSSTVSRWPVAEPVS